MMTDVLSPGLCHFGWRMLVRKKIPTSFRKIEGIGKCPEPEPKLDSQSF